MSDERLRVLERAVAEAPGDAHALYALRCAYVRAGTPEKALPFRVGDEVSIEWGWPSAAAALGPVRRGLVAVGHDETGTQFVEWSDADASSDHVSRRAYPLGYAHYLADKVTLIEPAPP